MKMENNTPQIDNFGWISIHRKIINNPIFDNPKAFKIWVWCLIKANKYKKEVLLGRKKILLKSGQFIFGSITACEQLKMSKSTLHFWMRYLATQLYIERQTTNRYSIITILNYIEYQTIEYQVKRQRNANETLNETNNKIDTINKINIISEDITKSGYGNPDINEIISYFKVTLGLPIIDGSIQKNRNYANLLIKKFGGVDRVKVLIDSTKANQFWSTKITSLIDLYYKGVNIISSGRNLKFQSTEIRV